MAPVIPLYETQEAVRVLVEAFRAPTSGRAPAFQAAVATLIQARAVLPRRVVRLVDALLVTAQPGASPDTVAALVDELAQALHANLSRERPGPLGPQPAATPACGRARQLQLF